MMERDPGKAEYSEIEAAGELGISIEALRALVRAYITREEEDLANVSLLTFRPSDLLLFKMLAEQESTSTVPN